MPAAVAVEETVENLKRLLAAYRDHVQDREGINFLESYTPAPAASRYLTLDECEYLYALEESVEVD